MHPEIKRSQPGICPECGMTLVPDKEKRSSDKHAGHRTADFLKKFSISLLLTIPVILYSDIITNLTGFRAPTFPGAGFLPLILSSIVFFYCGWVFLTGAWREITAKLPGMMTLIAIATSTAYLYSVISVFLKGETLFWELTTLITVMLLGHWLEMRAVSGAQGALKELSKLLPDTAEILRNGQPEKIPVGDLREWDLVFVRPGGRIPADGIISDGQSQVNEAMITGESAPVAKKIGSEVIAGTINGDGSLTIKITKVGEKTFLSGIMRLVLEAQSSKSRLQVLSDRAAFYLTTVAVAGGGATLISWILSGAGAGFAIERMVAVLVIACPHALGLAVPLVASISTTLAARNGFLVRQRLALEQARNIDVVLFDKTGTLTKGEFGVTNIWPVGSENEKEILELAASVDAQSEHVISKAIVTRAMGAGTKLKEVKNFKRLPGKGVSGEIDGSEIAVGGQAMLESYDLNIEGGLREITEAESKKGKTLIFLIKDRKLWGILALADLIREESREAISSLQKSGVRVAMITGDSEGVAAWVAGELNISEYFYKVLPGEKAEKVKLLQSKGQKVAMIGDGINDAPALTQADLGIAIGAGTNVAIESAGIILMRSDPRDIIKIIRLSKLTYSKMIQNLFWATGYNVVAMPLAAGVLVSQGIILEPALAALLMSVSTIIVALNAVLLKRRRL